MFKVVAVNSPELWTAGYQDVVVFSVKGKRSLASMLGGGDYDGYVKTIYHMSRTDNPALGTRSF